MEYRLRALRTRLYSSVTALGDNFGRLHFSGDPLEVFDSQNEEQRECLIRFLLSFLPSFIQRIKFKP